MTRINLVHPSNLVNKHLMAEYHELPRVFTEVHELIIKDKWDIFIESGDIPKLYVLGKGHMKFFYIRLDYLIMRFRQLRNELILREYDIDDTAYRTKFSFFRKVCNSVAKDQIYDWYPSPGEIYLNMNRITARHFKRDDIVESELKTFETVIVYENSKLLSESVHTVRSKNRYHALKDTLENNDVDEQANKTVTINQINKNGKITQVNMFHVRPNLSEEKAIQLYESYRMNEV